MEQISSKRLKKEKAGFYAHLWKKEDGTLDWYKWECLIPGPEDSPWEGGLFKLFLNFPQEYPAMPPRCVFEKKWFHPNIYPSGAVCLSIWNSDEDWRSSFKIKDILIGIQKLWKYPNEKSPAQQEAYDSYIKDKKDYEARVRKQAKECRQK